MPDDNCRRLASIILVDLPWKHNLQGVVALDQFASRPPLVSGRDGVRDQEPPSIVGVYLEARRGQVLGELPEGRPDRNGVDRHREQLTALGVSQRGQGDLEIEDAEMAERRPSPHDVHD